MTGCAVTQCAQPSECRPALAVLVIQVHNNLWGVGWVGLESIGTGDQVDVLMTLRLSVHEHGMPGLFLYLAS